MDDIACADVAAVDSQLRESDTIGYLDAFELRRGNIDSFQFTAFDSNKVLQGKPMIYSDDSKSIATTAKFNSVVYISHSVVMS